MIQGIRIRHTARASRHVVRSSREAGTGMASVRRRTERLRRKVTRSNSGDKLVIEMLPLARRIALRVHEHLPAQVEIDDLYDNGIVGLIDAVAKFDSTKRVKFESYARHRIRGAIFDGLRAADPATRELRQTSKRIQNLYRHLEVKLGRPVKDEEIAAPMGMNLAQWHRALGEIQAVGFDSGLRRVSAGATSPRQSTDPELLADGSDTAFDLTYRCEQREILDRALRGLRERERRVLNLYYRDEMTMKQIANRMGVDESRISQLHSVAVRRLKAGVNTLLQPRGNERTEPRVAAMAAGAEA